ncbi:MAG: hypothetical protein L3K14_04605 [Thermoplasmata archaeon]|nr:hypothetical protein [Thermoplasmata archaeon]
MTDYTSPELTAILIQFVIVLVIIRRSYAMTQGVPFSSLRNAAVPALILILWGVSELESFFLTPWARPYLIPLDVAILIGTSLAFTPVAERMTLVSRAPSGDWSYRIGFSFAALFVGAVVIRVTLAAALFPSSFEFGSPSGGFPPMQQQVVLAIIDAVFSVSAGLLVARSIGIQRKWTASRARAATVGAR